jgi:hypothetical protein
MRQQHINWVSRGLLVVLPLIALTAVLSGFAQPPQPDEGTAAHIFQLAITALVPATLLFLATADWQKPWGALRVLVFPAVVSVLSFAALYYLEQHFYLDRYR